MLASAEEEKLASGEMGSTNQHKRRLESTIQEAYQVLRRIYEAQAPMVEELEWTKSDEARLREVLDYRQCRYGPRDWWCNYYRSDLAFLQLCLEKLSSSNYTELDKQVQNSSRRLIHSGGGSAPSLRREREINRQIKQLQHSRKEAGLAKEEEKVDILRSWGDRSVEDFKQQIECQIKEIEDEINKENERFMTQKKEKLVGVNRNKAREYQHILDAQRLLEAVKTDYNQYVMTAARAKEIVEENCFDTLKELSNRHVEKFMSRWNNNPTFRKMYMKGAFCSPYRSKG